MCPIYRLVYKHSARIIIYVTGLGWEYYADLITGKCTGGFYKSSVGMEWLVIHWCYDDDAWWLR